MEYYCALTRLDVCSFSEGLLHLWHAKVASVLRVLVSESSHKRLAHFFLCLQHSFSFLNRSLLILSVNDVSLSGVLDSTSDIFQKLDVFDFTGVLRTRVVLFDQSLVGVAQLEEAGNFVEESLLRD